MHQRVIDISTTGYNIRARNKQLLLEPRDVGQKPLVFPICDVAVLSLSHPCATISLAALQELAKQDVVVVVCDAASTPLGMSGALYSNHISAKRARLQANLTEPKRKSLWRQIVRAKIENQAALLKALHNDDAGLREMISTVRSGDVDNREAVAAKKYWRALFPTIENFHRDQDGGDPVNAALNYGYAILRAIVARAIVAAGLTPCLTLHHLNPTNWFGLADDFMEPFRPVVDATVVRLFQSGELKKELTSDVKARVIRQITARYPIRGLHDTIFETMTKIAESYVAVLEGGASKLELPKSFPLEEILPLRSELYQPVENRRKDANPPF